MKTHTRSLLRILIALAILPCITSAITLSASFDGFSGSELFGYSQPGKQYTEGGLTFTSPTDLGVVGGNFAATLFGWGGYRYSGTALHVNNSGWVSVSAGSLDLLSVSFKYGFDWNGYAIECGLLTTSLDFQFWNDGELVGAGTFGESNGHGGDIVTISNGGEVFDQLLFRSSATLYTSATWDLVNGGWSRVGPLSTYSNANHIAFDDFSVQSAEAPTIFRSLRTAPLVASVGDSGGSFFLSLASAALVAMLSFRFRLSSA